MDVNEEPLPEPKKGASLAELLDPSNTTNPTFHMFSIPITLFN